VGREGGQRVSLARIPADGGCRPGEDRSDGPGWRRAPTRPACTTARHGWRLAPVGPTRAATPSRLRTCADQAHLCQRTSRLGTCASRAHPHHHALPAGGGRRSGLLVGGSVCPIRASRAGRDGVCSCRLRPGSATERSSGLRLRRAFRPTPRRWRAASLGSSGRRRPALGPASPPPRVRPGPRRRSGPTPCG